MGMSLEMLGVSKEYKEKEVVKSVYLSVEKGEFLTILGPGGSGKTTMLKLIAGFEKASEGIIRIDGSEITRKPTYKRNVGMIFHNNALFPHLTMAENIAFPLRLRKAGNGEIRKQTKEILERLRLLDIENSYPHELDHEQQCRGALARALVFKPSILLMDEPVTDMDKHIRKRLHMELKDIQRELGVTAISVTWDREEAMEISTRVCVMRKGTIVQVASPDEIYEKPNSPFVAEFIGETNLIKGTVVRAGREDPVVNIFGSKNVIISANDRFLCSREDVTIMIRPEKIRLITDSTFDGVVLGGTVRERVKAGEFIRFKLELGSGETVKVKTVCGEAGLFKAGDAVKIGIKVEDMVLIKN